MNRESCVLVLAKMCENQLLLPHIKHRRHKWEIIRDSLINSATGNFSVIFEPLSKHFLNVWIDNADRQSGLPGNSACNHGYNPYKPRYTFSFRSCLKRRPIPTAISCSYS